MDVTRWGIGLEDRLSQYIHQLEEHVQPTFEQMSQQVLQGAIRTQKSLLPTGTGRSSPPLFDRVGLSPAGIPSILQQKRAENLELMIRAGEDYAKDLLAVLDSPDTWNMTIGDLHELIQQLDGKSLSRSALIARDQVYKLNVALTRQLQLNAGVTKYVWATCRDDRVRPTHRANEGRTFYWSSPPAITGHPSHDPGCRCLPLPSP